MKILKDVFHKAREIASVSIATEQASARAKQETLEAELKVIEEAMRLETRLEEAKQIAAHVIGQFSKWDDADMDECLTNGLRSIEGDPYNGRHYQSFISQLTEADTYRKWSKQIAVLVQKQFVDIKQRELDEHLKTNAAVLKKHGIS